MPISIQCPNPDCEKKLKAKDESAGKRVKCPACGESIPVPAIQHVAAGKPPRPSPAKLPAARKVEPKAARPPIPQSRRFRWPWYAGGAGSLCIVAIVVVIVATQGGSNPENPSKKELVENHKNAPAKNPGDSKPPETKPQSPPVDAQTKTDPPKADPPTVETTKPQKLELDADTLRDALLKRGFKQHPQVFVVKGVPGGYEGTALFVFENKDSGTDLSIKRNLVVFFGSESPGKKFSFNSDHQKKNLEVMVAVLRDFSVDISGACEKGLLKYSSANLEFKESVGSFEVMVNKKGLQVNSIPPIHRP